MFFARTILVQRCSPVLRLNACRTAPHIQHLSSSTPLRNGDLISDPSSATSSLVEPSFAELGLGIHGTILPNGMLQSFLESVHVGLGVPWWESIMLTTVLIRGAIFPVLVKTQRNMIHMAAHQPEMDRLREAAMAEKDPERRRQGGMRLMQYMKENDIKPLQMYSPILANGLLMASMFFAIRGLANFPVQSMSSGGILWFQDLTLADPTFALPALTSLTVLLQIQLGADGMDKSGMPPGFKKLLYLLPVMSFPIMTQFPSALCLYWFTSNIISLVQSSILRIPAVRKALKINK